MSISKAHRHHLEALVSKSQTKGYGTVSVKVADAQDLGIPIDRTRLETEWALIPTNVLARALALAEDDERDAAEHARGGEQR